VYLEIGVTGMPGLEHEGDHPVSDVDEASESDIQTLPRILDLSQVSDYGFRAATTHLLVDSSAIS
jgi:hypothetical protein